MAVRDASRGSGSNPTSSRPVHNAPKISVVVALGDRVRVRVDRLRQLVSTGEAELEIVIAAASAHAEALAVLGRRGVVTTVLPDGTPRAELRATGMRRATGDVVVMLDEEQIADGRWRHTLAPFLPEQPAAPLEMQRYPA